jgi:hypothetical protein
MTNDIMKNKNMKYNNIKKLNNIRRMEKMIKINQIIKHRNTQNKNNQCKYTAIIVEPRKHAALSFVLENFLKNLSNEWNIIIFHGIQNVSFVNNIISNKLNEYKERISTINLNVNNLTRDEYSLLLKQKFFYDKISTEIFLVFQTDTLIFENNNKLIDFFLKYDYVGAPWPWSPKGVNNYVGNGGLSLRKKSKMIEIIEKDIDNNNLAEDVYFSCTDKVKLFKPSQQDAKLFSVEHLYSEVTFGTHQPWIIKKSNPNFYSIYPELQTLENLQHEIK